ncbi:hypothetical protein U5801_00265 [Lamprobacter modestohalophilus]|uniref:hypothetical protein n=1 Tax=Lamprobacter modestohalophilus TaxID=1064514 RepID=UPI002ADED405|nr:hypothetical protein [Lamprobacter modestohalophilus]MEA1048257.1 hypothetical protein [Lamprobacter modestohalophilus]
MRSRVLPGFQFRVNDLIRRPDLDAIRRDPVYSGFVLPEWTRAEEAQARAEQARALAEREREEASRERDQAGRERDQASRERDQASRERDQVSRERDEALAEARREAVARAALEAELARLRGTSGG